MKKIENKIQQLSAFEIALQKIAQTPKARVEKAIERDREKKAK